MIEQKIVFKILNRLSLLKFLNLVYGKKYEELIVKIPILHMVGYDYINHSSRELWLNNIIGNILQVKPGCFIDIGTNIGQTLIKLKSVDRERQYYGFEPNHVCSTYMEQLIALNNWKHCQVIPVGLSDRSNILRLFSSSDTDEAASIVDNFREGSFYSSWTYVPVFEGDSILQQLEIESIAIIKIDVEGAEAEVVRGLEGSISQYRPYILCEILPVYDSTQNVGRLRKEKQDALEKIIEQCNYKMFRLMYDGRVISLDTIEDHSDISLCNYVFVPEEEIDRFNKKLNLDRQLITS